MSPMSRGSGPATTPTNSATDSAADIAAADSTARAHKSSVNYTDDDSSTDLSTYFHVADFAQSILEGQCKCVW